ncbi:MAG TPA: hypothetical protein VFE36_12730 [Candidatus Baltobacteraceae bacterium]|nr:hypothetical protein [Candidatus Baltobacteraceae bacterium]
MAFGISGFGAPQLAASPQVFQALSLGGKQPQPPAPPYGTPNENLVPVGPGNIRAFPANLTLAAQSPHDSLARISTQTPLDVAHPSVRGGLPNTTPHIAATNPTITLQFQGPAPSGIPNLATAPQGPVSFLVGSPSGEAVALTAISRTAEDLQSVQRERSLAAGAAPTFVAAAPARSVATIVRTVTNLAVASVYPAAIFSFHA